MGSRERCHFLACYRIHDPIRVQQPMTERNHEETARSQQTDELPERALPLVRCNMHPDGAEQNDVEGQTEPIGLVEGWQGIGHPANAGAVVARHGLSTHICGWLYGDDFVTERCQPSGVTPRTRADIEDNASSAGK